MRYEHVLSQHRGAAWPYKVVCVDAADVDESELDSSGVHVPTLSTWSAVELRLADGQYDCHADWEGATVLAWWKRLTDWATGSKSATVVSSRANVCWAMLGLWNQLEEGNVQLYPPGFDAADPLAWAIERLKLADPAHKGAWSAGDCWREVERCCGFLVLSDPPLIARFRLRDSECWITWLGVENYGIQRANGITGGKATAAWVANAFRAYHSYCKEHSLGKLCATAGSQAVYGWRYGHYWPGCATHCDSVALSIESRAYYSGRAECYQLGPVATPLWYCDVRAAYCYHCRTASVPTRLHRVVESNDSATWNGSGHPGNAIGRVRVATHVALYPYREGGVTLWPVGTFDTVLAGPELALAFQRGHVQRVYEYAEYTCEPALASIAQALYDWRCAAKARSHSEMESVGKLLYVSLVGQFAKRQWTWTRYDDPDNDVLYGEWLGQNERGEQCRYRSIGGIVERETSVGYAPDTMPALSAWIASAARVHLIQLIELAGWDHVYYCDTDALMVDAAGRDALHAGGVVSADTLGSIGERWGPCDTTLLGIKWYTVDGKLVCAGLPDLDGVGVDSDGHWWKHETPKEAVRRRHRPAAAMRLTGYVRDSVYRHGVVDENGRVRPIKLG